MEGQWTGRYTGTNSGRAIVELDAVGPANLAGLAQLFDDDLTRPLSVGFITDIPKIGKFQLEIKVAHFNRANASLLSIEELKAALPGLVFPDAAQLEGEWTAKGLRIKWQTNVGSSGSAFLNNGRSEQKSIYRPRGRIVTWEKFKAHASALDRGRFIFRGQPITARLRTTFHRSSRANLAKYVNEDIPQLARRVSARGGHIFDLSRPGESGALYSLIQHHGFPTPLLDWTYSPYIAAYFAFRNADKKNNSDGKVRIFIFDNKKWRTMYPQYDRIALFYPHFSTIELTAIDNNRMMPQQALSSLTNIDDIEGYIRDCEKKSGEEFLTVIDLPISERKAALEDLSMMGITAGALMPGLDGVCEEMKNRLFGF